MESDTTIANNAAAIIPQANDFFIVLDVSDPFSNQSDHLTHRKDYGIRVSYCNELNSLITTKNQPSQTIHT